MPASVDGQDRDQRVVEASALLRPGGAITGWASLSWRGARWFTGVDGGGRLVDVPVVVHHHLGPHAGLLVSQEFLPESEIELVDGIPVTSAVRSVCFVMRSASDVAGAVIALDMAAYDDLVSIDEVRAYLPRLQTRTGVQLVRDAVELADENSWSPMETTTRLVCVRRGRPQLLSNAPIFDEDGRHVATSDLLDADAGVAIDYDSNLHLVARRRAADIGREATIRSVGLEHVVAVPTDRADDFAAFGRRLDQAYDRAAARPEHLRRWTLQPPPGWVATSTVAARRALGASDRSRLLRYRTG